MDSGTRSGENKERVREKEETLAASNTRRVWRLLGAVRCSRQDLIFGSPTWESGPRFGSQGIGSAAFAPRRPRVAKAQIEVKAAVI